VVHEPPKLAVESSDSIREYTPEEERRLTTQLSGLVSQVHAGHLIGRPLDEGLVRDLHAGLFGGVRQHAGKIRCADEGAEYLTYGPNKSARRDEVLAKLADVLKRGRESMASFARNSEDPEYERKAIHLAAWVHAEIIRIHPFEDGNGRVSRLVMSCVLVSLGLRPIPVEATRREYVECLNTYFQDPGKLGDLVDLCLHCYPVS